MARPNKQGLDYFPLDVDIFDDEKVIPISSEFGAKGECVVVRVLCAIYRNGYFVECSDAFRFKIAKQANIPHSLVAEVISGLVKWGFFDKSVFDSFGILTSVGIQKRWKDATRKRVHSDRLDYWLVNDFDYENRVSGGRNPNLNEFPAEETPLNTTETQQKKVKESKVIKEVDKSTSSSRSDAPTTQNTINTHAKDTIDYLKFCEWFNSETKGVFGNLKYPLGKKRRDAIRARVAERGKVQLFDAIRLAARSDWLKGQNRSGWTATFDWMIKPSNFEKLITGNYDNDKIKQNSTANSSRPTPEQLAAAVKLGIALADAEENE